MNDLYKTKLNPELFTYELYESNFWSVLGLSFKDSMELENLLRAIKDYGIGYCNANRLYIRPRDDSYAVMCEVDGEKFWFHIEKNTYNHILIN